VDDEVKKVAGGDWSQTVKASCPSCAAPLATNAKFCPECRVKLQTEAKCAKCGAKLQPGARLCAEYGTKV
jgi:predicted amidophosphoribosyltransferase